MKSSVWMCGVGLIVFLLLWFCSVSDAQDMPAPQSESHLRHAESHPGQAHHAGQKRPFTGKKRRDIPRPERNRFAETRHTGGGFRQRTSRRKNSSPRKRTRSDVIRFCRNL